MGFQSFPTFTMSFGAPGICSSNLTPPQLPYQVSRNDVDLARIEAIEKKMDTYTVRWNWATGPISINGFFLDQTKNIRPPKFNQNYGQYFFNNVRVFVLIVFTSLTEKKINHSEKKFFAGHPNGTGCSISAHCEAV